MFPEMREASWTAPALWRFAVAESDGRNPKARWTEMERRNTVAGEQRTGGK